MSSGMRISRRANSPKAGRDEGAGTDADIDIAFRQRHPLQRLFQRKQGANLIDTAEGTTPSEGDPQFARAATTAHSSLPSAIPGPYCLSLGSLRPCYSTLALCA